MAQGGLCTYFLKSRSWRAVILKRHRDGSGRRNGWPRQALYLLEERNVFNVLLPAILRFTPREDCCDGEGTFVHTLEWKECRDMKTERASRSHAGWLLQ